MDCQANCARKEQGVLSDDAKEWEAYKSLKRKFFLM
jgi:hypothetical protein